MSYGRQYPAGTVVAAAGRFSSDMQNPKSADDQLEEARQLSVSQGWHLDYTYKDEAKSGRSTRGRAAYLRMLDDAKTRRFSIIIVEDVDRLGRNAAELHRAFQIFKENGITVWTTRGGPLQDLELAIRAQLAEEEVKKLGLRVNRGHRAAAKRGQLIGGVAYGYKVLEEPDEDGLTRGIDETQAEIIRRAYKLFISGHSTTQICKIFNSEGIKGPGGKHWRDRHLTGNSHLQNGIFRNPLYAGLAVHGKTKSTFFASDGTTTVEPGPADKRITVEMERYAIVTQDDWRQVQAILASRAGKPAREVKQPEYPLSGLFRCGVCGETYQIVEAGRGMACSGRRANSGCTNSTRVSAEEIENRLVEGFLERLLTPDLLELFVPEYGRALNSAIADEEARYTSLESRAKEIGRDIKHVMNQVRGGLKGFAEQLVNEELERLGQERERVQNQLAVRPDKLQPLSSIHDAEARLRRLLADADRALSGPQQDARRARDIFRSFIDRIVLTPLEKADSKGRAPMRVTVEGSATALLDKAYLDRVIQRRGTNSTTVTPPIVHFRFYVDLPKRVTPSEAKLFADADILERALDSTYRPMTVLDMAARLAAEHNEPADRWMKRANLVLRELRRRGVTKLIRKGVGEAAYVPAAKDISVQEWRRRWESGEEPPRTRWRLVSAPEAFVTVIGSKDE